MKIVVQEKATAPIREIQLHQLEMLKFLSTVFDKEQISYFAVGGTALGAIRHEGFIPWDDDIDIAILRSDYEKFLAIQESLPENLKIINHKVDRNYPLYFSKVIDASKPFIESRLEKYTFQQGVFIDIFPWDKFDVYQTKKEELISANKIFERLVLKKKGNIKDYIKFLFRKIRYFFTTSLSAYKKLNQLSCKPGSKSNAKNWGYLLLDDYLHEDDIFPLRKQKFEDFEIFIPNKCEKYLTQKYGDYMKIPEEKNRYNHSTLKR